MALRAWRYVFITTPQPMEVLRAVRRAEGVAHADVIVLGPPDIVAIVVGDDTTELDAVTDRIAALPIVVETQSTVARCMDSVEPPFLPATAPAERTKRGKKK